MIVELLILLDILWYMLSFHIIQEQKHWENKNKLR